MPLFRRVKNAVSPWLAFAAVAGLGAVLVCAILLAAISLFLAISSLANGSLMNDFRATVNIIPGWIAFSAGCCAVCSLTGFWMGGVSALIGGAPGRWWSFLAFLGMLCLLPTFSRDADIWLFFSLPLAFLGIACTKFAEDLLEWDAPKFKRDARLRSLLRNSWLRNPPYLARFFGLIFPIVCGFLIWPVSVLPIFLEHLDYTGRLGISSTWKESNRMLQWQSRPHWYRSSCQSNLKQIMLGTLQYEQDFDEVLPAKPHSPEQGVAALIEPYLKSTQIFQCPEDFVWEKDARFSSGDFTDYWVNGRLYSSGMAKLERVNTLVMWGDGNTGAGEANAAYSLSAIPPNFPPATRHRDGANYAFMDGHVKWFQQGKVSNTASASNSDVTLNP